MDAIVEAKGHMALLSRALFQCNESKSSEEIKSLVYELQCKHALNTYFFLLSMGCAKARLSNDMGNPHLNQETNAAMHNCQCWNICNDDWYELCMHVDCTSVKDPFDVVLNNIWRKKNCVKKYPDQANWTSTTSKMCYYNWFQPNYQN